MSRRKCVPKLTGGDVELGNFIVGGERPTGKSDYEASRLLLARVEGLPRRHNIGGSYWGNPSASYGSYGGGYYYGQSGDGRQSQDWGRKYLRTNGGCIYIDLNHLELATPEVLCARDYQAVWTAMLRIARGAQQAVNDELDAERRVIVLANNSDRDGNSYGGHQSFLMSRTAWDEMIRQRMIPGLFFLMAYQVSSIVFTGQGKVGSENGAPHVPYQISQRADFIETLLGEQTTFNRPLINTRDEPLCGPASRTIGADLPGDRYARLHVIFYDTNLAPVATYLKVGVMQLVLTMIEAGFVDDQLVLDEPLRALRDCSHDPDLRAKLRLRSGRELTVVELQLEFLAQAKTFAREHGFEQSVPGAAQVIELWEDTLLKLEAEAFQALRGRIDWVMKRALIEEALTEHPEWNWTSPEITYLDQIYSSLDPGDGLFLALDSAGRFEAVAAEAEIARYVDDPPDDTRAWTRAMLLRAAGPDRVTQVDWDKIVIRSEEAADGRLDIHLLDPLGGKRAVAERAFLESPDFPTLLSALRDAHLVAVVESARGHVSAANTAGGAFTYEIN